MKHITHIQYRRDGKLHSAKVDITLENLEEFRRECMEHYRRTLFILLTKKRINYDKRRD